MKRLIFAAALLAACQPSDHEEPVSVKESKVEVPNLDSVTKDGKVHLKLMPAVSEARACILPIRVENGLDGDVNVTMIGFSVTGPGEDTTGNMFAPVAKSGTASQARVILEGQSCDAFDTITVPQVLCKTEETDCAPKVNFVDGDGLRFSQAG